MCLRSRRGCLAAWSVTHRDRHPNGGFTQRRIAKTNIAVRRGEPPVSEQISSDMHAFDVHDRGRGVRAAQVMKQRIRRDFGRVACLDSEFPQVI